MATSKIPVAPVIPLSPLDNTEFYAAVIPEKDTLCLWIFKVRGGTALCQSSSYAKAHSPSLTVDGIKTQDQLGLFDNIKEELLELD